MWIFCSFFFFNDTATTEIYTLSLHDALPISGDPDPPLPDAGPADQARRLVLILPRDALAAGLAARRVTGSRSVGDRKSTRLNSSHANISYAVFCLKKKKNENSILHTRTRSNL